MDFRIFLKGLLLPPFFQIIVIFIAWLMRRRKPKLAWGLCIFATISLWVLGSPIAANFLTRTLDHYPAIAPEQLSSIQADAIVILTASQINEAPEFGQPVSREIQLSRLRYGAFLQHKTRLPVLLSGGSVRSHDRRSLAETMAYDLSMGYNVEARWLETKSRTTMENANYSYGILSAKGKTSILLVTSSIHMPRAKWSFEKAGFKVLPAPTGLTETTSLSITSFVPTAEYLSLSRQALHEWLGYIVYRLF